MILKLKLETNVRGYHIYTFCNYLLRNFKLLCKLNQNVTVVDFEPTSTNRCGFECRQGLWLILCKEAIAVMSDTVVGLQMQFNILHQICNS
jgi:hypothetical protein